jgi:hypothetical protein
MSDADEEIKNIYVRDKCIPCLCVKAMVDMNQSGADDFKSLNPYKFITRTSTEGRGVKATSIVRSINFQSTLSNEAAANVYFSSQEYIVNNANKFSLGDTKAYILSSMFRLKSNDALIDTFANDKYSYDPVAKNAEVQQTAGEQFASSLTAPSPRVSEEAAASRENQRAREAAKGLLISMDYNAWPDKLRNYMPLSDAGYNPPPFEGMAKDIVDGQKIMRQAIRTSWTVVGGSRIPDSYQALVNLKLEMELEGISGMRVGDCFIIDNMPAEYRRRGVFQIWNLSHNVDKNNWVTRVIAQYRIQLDQERNESVNN